MKWWIPTILAVATALAPARGSDADLLEQMAEAVAGTCPFDVAIGRFEADRGEPPCPPSFSGPDTSAIVKRLSALQALEPPSRPLADPVAEARRLRARAVWRVVSSRSESVLEAAAGDLEMAMGLDPQNVALAADLAGVLVLRGRITEDPRYLLRALDLVAAVAQGQTSASTNRRVVLKELGFLDDGDAASRAWESARSEWETGRLSTAALVERADRFPQQLRELAEQELLGWWAAALGDPDEAERRLATLTEVARAVAESKGEMAFSESVAQLHAEPARHARLAAGYRAYRIGTAAIRALDYEVAARELQVAHVILEAESSPMAQWARHYRAVADFFLGAVSAALEEQLVVAAAARERTGRRSLEARALWSIGHILLTSSRAPQAIEPTETARDVFAALGEEENLAAVEFLLAEIYPSLGEEVLALRALREASRRRGVITNLVRRHNIDMVWLEHARRLGLRQAAQVFLVELERSAEALGDPLARFQVALVALALEQDSAGIEELESQARAHLSRIADGRFRALAEGTLEVELAKRLLVDETGRAAAAAARATAVFRRWSFEGEVEAVLMEAIAAARLGELERSEALLLEASRRVASIRAGVADPAGRARYLATAERIATVWKDLMDRAGANDERVWAGVAALRRAARGDGASTAGVPSFAGLVGGLAPKSLVVEYLLGEEDVEAWYFSSAGVRRQRLEVPLAELRRLVRAWQGGDATALSALSAALMAGASPWMRDVERITVVPTDILFAVPWPQLQAPGSAEPLVARFELAVALSSLQAGAALVEQEAAARALFVVDPEPSPGAALERLPGSLAEASRAGRWYVESETLTGRDANITALQRRLADRPAVVHIGAHVASEDPVRGGRLVLAPDPHGGDGEVDAMGLTRLPFDGVRTVVLAACRGRDATREGAGAPFDLVRALVEAGAAEVVASDRDLDDQLTAHVMALLHRHLAAGWSGAAALRRVWLETEDPRLRAAVESFQVVRQHL